MNYSLESESLKVSYIGRVLCRGVFWGLLVCDARNLDRSSYELKPGCVQDEAVDYVICAACPQIVQHLAHAKSGIQPTWEEVHMACVFCWNHSTDATAVTLFLCAVNLDMVPAYLQPRVVSVLDAYLEGPLIACFRACCTTKLFTEANLIYKPQINFVLVCKSLHLPRPYADSPFMVA